jgi:LysM repeat protein
MGRDRGKGRDRDQDADWEFTPSTDDDDESPFYGPDHDRYHDDALVDDIGSADLGALMVRGGVAGDIVTLGNGSKEVEPVLIPGTGVSMGRPFIKRRERPLTMRLAVVTIMVCLLVTGLFTVTPLAASTSGGSSMFQVLSGTVVFQSQPSYHWYTAVSGDSLEGIAAKFNVQIGGIYELNGLLSGQEITIGKAYKIPDDPYYGKNYRPPAYIAASNGSTTFGNSPWTSMAGNPLPEALCSTFDGHGNPLAYHLVAPNPHSYWVRGFSWYHDGVDISTVAGNPIIAAQGGEVIWAGWDVGGLGYSVKINNCYGISTVYGHMEALLVKRGAEVQQGAQIGLEGSTGWSTGPHLHYMVEVNNNPVDPSAYYGYNCRGITGNTSAYSSGATCD